MRMGASTVVGTKRLSVGDETGTGGPAVGGGDADRRPPSDPPQAATRRKVATTIESRRQPRALFTPSWWHGRERAGPRVDDDAGRRRAAALAGHRGDEPAARALL